MMGKKTIKVKFFFLKKDTEDKVLAKRPRAGPNRVHTVTQQRQPGGTGKPGREVAEGDVGGTHSLSRIRGTNAGCKVGGACGRCEKEMNSANNREA